MTVTELSNLGIHDLPDFSRVGYREGHIAIPQVPVRATISPSSNNADDTARIQEAIDKVSGMDLMPVGNDGAKVRGAVLLKAGVYQIAGALVLHSSGVVLRGEGQSAGGTTVKATGELKRDFILMNGMLKSENGSAEFLEDHQRDDGYADEAMMPKNGYNIPSPPDTYTREGVDIPVNEIHIPVKSTASFKIGDRIVIARPATEDWIESIGMDKFHWEPEGYTFRFERRIIGIDSHANSIEIDIPMVMSLDAQYPPAAVFKLQYKEKMISDVGIENMLLMSDHKNDNEDEDHAWYAVVLDNVRNGWVADVTAKHFACGIFASTWSRYITIQNCSVLEPFSQSKEGRRRYAFNLSGQMGLVKECVAKDARHDFITLGRVCGPNAFVESEGSANNDTGPHERWAMGTLYDNIICNTLNVRNRGPMGTGQGWAGVYQVVYNCTAENGIIWDAPGTKNWLIGFKGHLDDHTDGQEIGIQTASIAHGSMISPLSLYSSQLIKRTESH